MRLCGVKQKVITSTFFSLLPLVSHIHFFFIYVHKERKGRHHHSIIKLYKHNKKFFIQLLRIKHLNSLDDSILHIDVSTEGLVIVHNLGSFDQETVALEDKQ